MTDDNPRITALTTDAIRSIGEKMIAEIHRQVKEVDDMAKGIHELAKAYEEEIGLRTLELTDHITAYTALGAKTSEMFRLMSEAMRGIKTNGEPMVNIVPIEPEPVRARPRAVDLNDEMGKLAALAASPTDGRR